MPMVMPSLLTLQCTNLYPYCTGLICLGLGLLSSTTWCTTGACILIEKVIIYENWETPLAGHLLDGTKGDDWERMKTHMDCQHTQ